MYDIKLNFSTSHCIGGQRFYASSASTCRAAVPAAATVTAVPLRTAAALRFAVSHDGLRSDDKIHETALQRRWMLLGGALVAAGGLYSLSPAAAASSSTCELDSSPSGFKFCDEREGTGPEPVKGALIRCGGLYSTCCMTHDATARGATCDAAATVAITPQLPLHRAARRQRPCV